MNKVLFLIVLMLFPNMARAEGLMEWKKWNRSPNYVFSGQYEIAGDPSIIKINNHYLMYYGCFDPMRKPQGTDICVAASKDGFAWNMPDTGNKNVLGQVMVPSSETWHSANETPFAIAIKGSLWLYFTGYKDKGGIFKSAPANLGLAISRDGVKFSEYRVPVIKTSATSYDRSAIASPSIIEKNGTLNMVYAGYCIASNCLPKVGTAIMMATSSNGVKWNKNPKPIFESATLPSFVRSAYDMGEPELIVGPDGYFYLFFTATQGDDPPMIGVARSQTLDGPWVFNPEPIIKIQGNETEVVAPNVLIEGNKVRMWFSAFTPEPRIHIGYAETSWPLFK